MDRDGPQRTPNSPQRTPYCLKRDAKGPQRHKRISMAVPDLGLIGTSLNTLNNIGWGPSPGALHYLHMAVTIVQRGGGIYGYFAYSLITTVLAVTSHR